MNKNDLKNDKGLPECRHKFIHMVCTFDSDGKLSGFIKCAECNKRFSKVHKSEDNKTLTIAFDIEFTENH